MERVVEVGDEFKPEFDKLAKEVRLKILASHVCCSNLGRN